MARTADQVRFKWGLAHSSHLLHFFQVSGRYGTADNSVCGKVVWRRWCADSKFERRGPNDCPDCWRAAKDARRI